MKPRLIDPYFRLLGVTVENTPRGMRDAVAVVLESMDMNEDPTYHVRHGSLVVTAAHLRMIAARLEKFAKDEARTAFVSNPTAD